MKKKKGYEKWIKQNKRNKKDYEIIIKMDKSYKE